MGEHVIYYFSGTGNSLWTALSIKKSLENCTVISMGAAPERPGAATSIGFVFPCYFGGVPQRVLKFIAELDFSLQQDTYYYAVATYGALIGATLEQTAEALRQRDITLNYAASLKSFSNYVVAYDMSEKVAEKIAQTKTSLQELVPCILAHQSMKIKSPSPLVVAYNKICAGNLGQKDENFQVNESCNGCTLCQRVCPVHNIHLDDGRPSWLHRCEQCLACLHWCPQRAINYGKKTQKRRRYTHPEITSKMFITYLNGEGTNGKHA